MVQVPPVNRPDVAPRIHSGRLRPFYPLVSPTYGGSGWPQTHDLLLPFCKHNKILGLFAFTRKVKKQFSVFFVT